MKKTPVLHIGNVPIYGHFGLAPMAGVTDRAFRQVCVEHGASYTVTEMVSAQALCYQDKKTRRLLSLFPGEKPVAVQLFGSKPEVMAQGAEKALALSGAQIIDINMGCPAPKISGNCEGAALMREPTLARSIIKAVVEAVSCPVTVKFRKGWDENNINGIEFAKMAEDSGASAVCIHGRTRAQMYAGAADWEYMAKVVSAVSIPVLVNGDAASPESARSLLLETGAKMALIGRGALGNPWLFAQAEAAFAGQPVPPLPPLSERLACALRQIHLAAEEKGERTACMEARKHFVWYLKGVKGAAKFRAKATALSSLDEIPPLMEEILSHVC